MNLTDILTNDQLAVVGCFAALSICGIVAAITFHVGPAGKKSIDATEARRLRIPDSTPAGQDSEQRRAA